MKWSDITPLKVMAIIIIANGTLIGGANFLKDLFGAQIVTYIVAVASIGNMFFGALVGMFSTQGSIVNQVQSMPGVDKILINAQANPALAQMAMGSEAPKVVPLPSEAAAVSAIAKTALLVAAVVLSAFLASGQSALAQGARRQPQMIDPFKPIGDKIKSDLDQANSKVTAAVTGQPASDPKAALPCMDITVLFKLTPANLVPTMKACVQDANNQLVTDTLRALDSAKNYTKTGENTPVGDSDGINCLTPALALFQAAAIVPATPDVLNPDGSVKTKGAPEIDPGLILLFQKYREFTISGGLTSCQAWVNGPVNATAAAGIAGVGAAAGAALLLPK